MPTPLASHDFTAGGLDPALEFLKRIRWELRILRKVHVFRDRIHFIDVNADSFELRGVGFPDPEVVPILRAVNAAFDPESIHNSTEQPFKEFATGRRHTWAEDRVM